MIFVQYNRGHLKNRPFDALIILLYIKKSDERFVSIKRDVLHEIMNHKENLLEKSIERCLLTTFKGSEKELIVDDNDVLADMIYLLNIYL